MYRREVNEHSPFRILDKSIHGGLGKGNELMTLYRADDKTNHALFNDDGTLLATFAVNGEVRFWDSTANQHEGGMLVRSHLPAGALVEGQVEAARTIARQTADALGYVGVLTLEFFATKGGPVFNEMAPRVHNSGHWTIEGAATSQFENHIRAIAGLPLGETATRFAEVDMRNIVGEDALAAHTILAEDGEPHLHLYGKREAREGRKMGHVTRVSNKQT